MLSVLSRVYNTYILYSRYYGQMCTICPINYVMEKIISDCIIREYYLVITVISILNVLIENISQYIVKSIYLLLVKESFIYYISV